MSDSVQKPLPGQFRLRDLFVLTTLAAVAAWIMSWPLSLHSKVFFVFMLWCAFRMWQLVRLRFLASPTRRVNVAVTEIVGQLIMFAVFTILTFTPSRPLGRVEFIFIGLFAIIVGLPIWRAVRTIREAVAEKQAKPT